MFVFIISDSFTFMFHRGARHGLSLSGKLNRIEEQERQLLEKYSHNFDSNVAQEVFKDWVEVDTDKKKKRKVKPAIPCEPTVTSPDSEKLATLLNESDYVVKYKSKKKKRRHKALDEDLATSLSKCLSTSHTLTGESDDNKLHGILNTSTVIKKKGTKKVEKKKSKKKKRKPMIDDGIVLDEDVEITEVDGIASEARKYLKKSKHSLPATEDGGVDEVDAIKVQQSKKCKRKHKEAKADKIGDSTDDIPKVSKREISKMKKNNRKIEKIAKKLQSIVNLDEIATVDKPKMKKKKKKKSN